MSLLILLQAALLGLVEGLTEFIPVSSTGHQLLVGHFIGFHSPNNTFEVLIQLGAILAILAVYFRRLIGIATASISDRIAVEGSAIRAAGSAPVGAAPLESGPSGAAAGVAFGGGTIVAIVAVGLGVALVVAGVLGGPRWLVLPALAVAIPAVLVAALLPAGGAVATGFSWGTTVGVGVLFLLYGARMAPAEAVAGLRNWRLQGSVAATTYLLFPLLGTGLALVVGHVLDELGTVVLALPCYEALDRGRGRRPVRDQRLRRHVRRGGQVVLAHDDAHDRRRAGACHGGARWPPQDVGARRPPGCSGRLRPPLRPARRPSGSPTARLRGSPAACAP